MPLSSTVLTMTSFDLIGLVGVFAYISAYALLQLGKLGNADNLYLALNAFGSILILVSLLHSFNLPSFVTQVAWLIFTVVGFVRARAAKLETADGT